MISTFQNILDHVNTFEIEVDDIVILTNYSDPLLQASSELSL